MLLYAGANVRRDDAHRPLHAAAPRGARRATPPSSRRCSRPAPIPTRDDDRRRDAAAPGGRRGNADAVTALLDQGRGRQRERIGVRPDAADVRGGGEPRRGDRALSSAAPTSSSPRRSRTWRRAKGRPYGAALARSVSRCSGRRSASRLRARRRTLEKPGPVAKDSSAQAGADDDEAARRRSRRSDGAGRRGGEIARRVIRGEGADRRADAARSAARASAPRPSRRRPRQPGRDRGLTYGDLVGNKGGLTRAASSRLRQGNTEAARRCSRRAPTSTS